MLQNKRWVPYESATLNFEQKKTLEIKNVLASAPIFKKSWSLWTKAWLASSLLEQTLKKPLVKVFPTGLLFLFSLQQWLNPKKLGGKHDQKPQHNPKGNCTAEWSQFLFWKSYPCLIMPAKISWFFSTYSSFCRLFGSKFHKIFLVQWAFLVNKIMWFLFLCSFK